MSHHAGSGNQTQVLRKNRKWSWPVIHLSHLKPSFCLSWVCVFESFHGIIVCMVSGDCLLSLIIVFSGFIHVTVCVRTLSLCLHILAMAVCVGTGGTTSFLLLDNSPHFTSSSIDEGLILVCSFETRSHCVALAGLDLTIETRLPWNSPY